jgi:hypothetical protein
MGQMEESGEAPGPRHASERRLPATKHLAIQMRDRGLELGPGEIFVVPEVSGTVPGA